jgi:uncharacterized RDD family membrane protein YckC
MYIMEQSAPVSSQVIQAPRLGAGFGPRAGAQVIDLIIHNALSLVAGLVFGILIGVYALATGTHPSVLTAKLQASTPIGFILALTGYVIYHTICEGMHGATLGKLIFKIHVLKEDGNPASIVSAFIRSLAFYVDAMFFGIVAAASMRSSEQQQRLGDKWAKTVVVERSIINQYQWPSAWKFIMVFLLAIVADTLIILLSLMLKLM